MAAAGLLAKEFLTAPAKVSGLASRRNVGSCCEQLQAMSLSSIPCPPQRVSVVSPEAKRVCDLTGKKRNNGYSVSFSNSRTKKLQQPNLQHKRIWWETGKRYVKLKLSTKAIKTMEWKGLEKMAKEAGIDLNQY